ncbi:MAG: hypothetical protein Q7U02_09430, partial [Desulfosalsimonadaceae bacterium]|nr:hypothetical protein [Desulfosalsimonadaceae bacterium]
VQEFLETVKRRAEGHIESPFIEYLLSVKYLSEPAREFIDGYRQQFNSEGHPKAKGLKIALQLPKSWKANEGERSHILQKWTSQNGTGFEMISLDIRDSEVPTDAKIEELVSSGKIRESIPNGATYINSGVFSLEGRKGNWIELTNKQEKLGVEMYQHGIEYQLYYNDKAITLLCLSSNPDKKMADDRLENIKPLFLLVLNHFILLQA